VKSLEMAMKDAGMKESDIDYINAHATGTPAVIRRRRRQLIRFSGVHDR